MSELPYLCSVTRAISPGNADEYCARNTGLTKLIFSSHVKSHFPEKLQLETPKHKLLVVNSYGSHPPGNYLVLFHVFMGQSCGRWFFCPDYSLGCLGNPKDPGPNLILTEGVHHIPKEVLSLGILSVEIKVQGGEWMKNREATRFWVGVILKKTEDFTLYFLGG